MERRVFEDLQPKMLDPELVAIYYREYHLDFARRAKDAGRNGDQLERQHREAIAKVQRLVAAIAAGGGEFEEIREALSAAKAERDAIAEQLAQVEQLPVIALHAQIIEEYRAQVADLSTISDNPEARLEAIPKLRSLIDRVILRPAADAKGRYRAHRKTERNACAGDRKAGPYYHLW